MSGLSFRLNDNLSNIPCERLFILKVCKERYRVLYSYKDSINKLSLYIFYKKDFVSLSSELKSCSALEHYAGFILL